MSAAEQLGIRFDRIPGPPAEVFACRGQRSDGPDAPLYQCGYAEGHNGECGRWIKIHPGRRRQR